MKQAPASMRTRLPAVFSSTQRLHVRNLDTLDEITVWLGTFRERLRIAQAHEHAELTEVIAELEAHYMRRRAELA